MELMQLVKILWKRIWLLIFPAVIAGVAAFLLTGEQEDTYTSAAMLSTGLSGSRVSLDEDERAFVMMRRRSNIIELGRSRAIFDNLSYQLLYHDLNAEEPFRTLPTDLEGFPYDKRGEIKQLLQSYFSGDKPQFNLQEYGLLQIFLEAFDYNFHTLVNAFKVIPAGDSDYLRVIYEAESPRLVLYAINTYNEIFISTYHTHIP